MSSRSSRSKRNLSPSKQAAPQPQAGARTQPSGSKRHRKQPRQLAAQTAAPKPFDATANSSAFPALAPRAVGGSKQLSFGLSQSALSLRPQPEASKRGACAAVAAGTQQLMAGPNPWLSRPANSDVNVAQVDLSPRQGVAKRKARNANTKFILEQRAEMRARLVQLACEGKLRFGQASLPGFRSTTAPAAASAAPIPGAGSDNDYSDLEL